MYPEFIAIYIGMAVIIALGVAILILLIKLLKNSNDLPMPKQNITPTIKTQPNVSNDSNQENGNMAFCKKCATQFNASERFCPKCGTSR